MILYIHTLPLIYHHHSHMIRLPSIHNHHTNYHSILMGCFYSFSIMILITVLFEFPNRYIFLFIFTLLNNSDDVISCNNDTCILYVFMLRQTQPILTFKCEKEPTNNNLFFFSWNPLISGNWRSSVQRILHNSHRSQIRPKNRNMDQT